MTDDPRDWAARTEAAVLDAALPLVRDCGFTPRLTRRAAAAAGLSEADAELLLPNGPRDLAALMSRRWDAEAMAALAGVDPAALKVRERIARAASARVEAAAAHPDACRRLAGFLLLPHNLPLGLKLLWESADALWRWAGDTATDENHYSKRAILSAVLASTLATRLSAGRAAAEAHLAARIADVMAFEKWKAGLGKRDLGLELASALGRIRYGR